MFCGREIDDVVQYFEFHNFNWLKGERHEHKKEAGTNCNSDKFKFSWYGTHLWKLGNDGVCKSGCEKHLSFHLY